MKRPMRLFAAIMAEVLRERAGNVLPIAAVGILLAAAMVGSAVDFSRYYRVHNQLQVACDAGVLAGRRAVTTNGLDSTATAAAEKFFSANFLEASNEVTKPTFVTSSPDNGNTISAVATTKLDTLIMRLFGFDDFALKATCSASMGVGNADVMMVLDTTGSMDEKLSGSTQTRISALRSAMKNFYTTISTSTSGTNARVRYGFVPYSSTVNVGRLLYALNPAYLKDKHSYQSRVPYYANYANSQLQSSSTGSYSDAETTSQSTYAGPYNSSQSCQNALPNTTSWVSSGSTSTGSRQYQSTNSNGDIYTQTVTQTQTRTAYGCVASWSWSSGWVYTIYKYAQRRTLTTTNTYLAPFSTTISSDYRFDHWEYRKQEYATNVFKTFASVGTYTGDKGTLVNSTWAGCIEERATKTSSSFSYSSATGYSPSGAYDIDIDSAPTSSDDTKWAPMWTKVTYTRTGTVPNNFTMSTTTTGPSNPVDEYCPQQARGLAEMTQSAFNTYTDSLSAIGGTYLDIGMIWGGRMLSPDGIFANTVNIEPTNGGEVARHIVFMTDGEMSPSNWVQTAWGVEWFDRRVTTDGTTGDAARHTSRFLAVCNAIKAKGIRIWVVAFTSGLSTDLQTCASSQSSFTASSSAELNAAFQEIASEVGELRLIQ